MTRPDRSTGEKTFPQPADDLDCEQAPHETPFDRQPLDLCAVYVPYAVHFALDIRQIQFYK